MNNKAIYIQGIYSTAFSKIFKDRGFEIAFPSKTIAKRLSITNPAIEWSAAIISNPQPFGLKIFGELQVVEEISKIIRETLDPVIIRKSKVNLGLVAFAEVEEEGERKSMVNAKNIKGFIAGKWPKGSKLIVSIKDPCFGEDVNFFNGICLVGKYAMLIQNGSLKIPKHISKSWKGKMLLNIAKDLPKGWGAEFFETCINTDEKIIREEVAKLTERANQLLYSDKVGILDEGIGYQEIYLSYESKRILDEIRNEVLPTVKWHHYLRSFGENFNLVIEFSENLLSSGVERGKVEEKLEESVFSEIFKNGKIMNIFHYKPDGRMLKLSPGKIVEVDSKDKTITLLRKIIGLGIYDGIDAKKEIGDYAIAKYKLGSMVTRTFYYRKDGSLIGIYSNFSTPVEFYPNHIRYVDLEMDLVLDSKKNVKILDRDKLEDLLIKGYISEKLYWKVIELAEEEKKFLQAYSHS